MGAIKSDIRNCRDLIVFPVNGDIRKNSMSASIVTGREQQSNYPQKFAELTDNVLFGDMWTRTQLKPRERSLATVAALVAMYRLEQLPFHLKRALITACVLTNWPKSSPIWRFIPVGQRLPRR